MSIKKKAYARKDGTVRHYYQAVVVLPMGRQIAQNFDRAIDAERWERQQRSLTDQGQVITRKHDVPTVSELSERWLAEHSQARKAASSYVRDQKLAAHQILPHLGGVKVSLLNPMQVESWMNVLATTLSAKTTNDALGLLKKMLSDAVRWRILPASPIASVRRLPVEQRDYKFWSQAEAECVLEYLHNSEQEKSLAFMLALNTGMRRGELRALAWDSVNLERRLITVRQSYCEYSRQVKCTKSRRIRQVPINSQLLAVLVEERAKAQGALVLPGFRFNNSTKPMRRICEAAGVGVIRFHDLRHTFASHYMMRGGKLYDLQQLLGHATIEMTSRYAHLSPDHWVGKTDISGFGTRPNVGVVNLLERRLVGQNLD